MEDKVGLLLDKVERMAMHMRHRVPPEVVGIDEILRLVDEMRVIENAAPACAEAAFLCFQSTRPLQIALAD
jgi:hypothetical protein